MSRLLLLLDGRKGVGRWLREGERLLSPSCRLGKGVVAIRLLLLLLLSEGTRLVRVLVSHTESILAGSERVLSRSRATERRSAKRILVASLLLLRLRLLMAHKPLFVRTVRNRRQICLTHCRSPRRLLLKRQQRPLPRRLEGCHRICRHSHRRLRMRPTAIHRATVGDRGGSSGAEPLSGVFVHPRQQCLVGAAKKDRITAQKIGGVARSSGSSRMAEHADTKGGEDRAR